MGSMRRPQGVIQGQEGWKVTYSPTKICALKGSTVEINCTYRYSPTKRPVTTVDKTVWFRRENYHGPVDLSTDSQYSGRVQSYCENNICTLRITDVRESDSAEYKFRFITNQPDRRFTGSPGVTLSVTDLQVTTPKGYQSYRCHSSRCLPDHTSYIWYRNGQTLQGKTSYYLGSIDADSYTDSYTCALKGHEDFHSPFMCRNRDYCKKVTYNQRSICAPKGSSVDISCTYYSYYVESKFWFSTPRSHQWQSPSQPQDLSKDTKFNGRVQVLEPETGRSTLRISDLTENDSAEYRFKFRTRWFEWGNSLPGTTLTVTVLQVKVTRVKVHQSYTEAELECRNSCISASYLSYVWFKNGQELIEEQSFSYKGQFNPGDTISCALKEHKTYRSPSLYALKVPSVSVNPSAEVMENTSVTLTCSSDANPAANYTWYKKNRDSDPQPLSKESEFVFRSIKSSDFGEYYCIAENELGKRTSENISVIVRYPPKLPSVSVSPSGEIVEGSSVTLTCSSDANPAANYTWYKENQTLIQGPKGVYHFTSISSEDRENYYCKSENHYGQNSTFFFLDVHYAPKLPSVSVSPSGEIVEGSSVNLTCSSDANPAANYTWYKENEDSPKASGQIFIITDFKAEDSGNYYCQAQNKRGHHNSTFSLTVVTGAWKSISAVTTTAVVLLIMLFTVPVLIRKKKASKQSPEPEGRPDNREQYLPTQRQSDDEQNDLNYASVRFYKNQEDSLYSNIGAAQHLRHQEAEDQDVHYAAVQFISSSSTAPRQQKSAAEDAETLYSTVNKTF